MLTYKNFLKYFIVGTFCLAVWICGICIISTNLLAYNEPAYGVQNTNSEIENETFGAEINPTGEPIGGGNGYQRYVTTKDFQVETFDGLIEALKHAKYGQVIYIDDKAVINLTNKQKISIPGGVTIASGRGRKGSPGALLFSTNLDTRPLIMTNGEHVRITGLRIQGPDPERRTEQMQKLFKEDKYYSIPNSGGIHSSHTGLEIDNCELWGWSHAAIFLDKGAKAYIHHNHIHHNQRWGLGYGVCLNEATANIEANIFDWCRHAIAGTGRLGTSYEACYNIVLENANSYSFDMHGGADRKDGTDIAGDWIKIHHNTFRNLEDVRAVLICGRPREIAEIHHNWFLHSDVEKAVGQMNGVGNMHVYKNLYTSDKILKE